MGVRLEVRISERPGPLGDQFVEVVGLGGGELAHGEVVEDEQVGAGEFARRWSQVRSACPPARSARSAAGLGEADLGAGADGQVAQGLGDVGLADPDRAVEDHRLAGVQPAQGGEVADLRGGQFRAGGEVEPFQGGCCSKRARRSRRLMRLARGG